jgi:peptidoglycan/LPS O-acetylase OafA/YrhL
MCRWLTRLVPALVVAVLLALPAGAQAQQSGNPEQAGERPPPIMSWVVTVLATVGVMLILCVPSRKA